jgi:hypothetical protein
MRLSPLDTEMFRMHTGIAFEHFIARRFDEARHWVELREVSQFMLASAAVASSCAHAGHTDEARRAAADMRRLDPKLTVSALDAWLPFHRREDFALFAEGLRKAGMPE